MTTTAPQYERNAAIAAAYQSPPWPTLRELGDAYGLSVSRTSKIVNDYADGKRPNGQPKQRRIYGVEDINWDALPHDRARVALALYLTGDPIDSVADSAGVSVSAVQAWLAQSRLRGLRSDCHDLDPEELGDRVAAGHRMEDMCVHFGCSEGHLRNQLARLGLIRRRPAGAGALTAGNPLVGARNAALIAAHQRSQPPPTLQELGDSFGLTRERVRQILTRHGITERRGRERAPATP